MKNIAVFASGNGSNYDALIRDFKLTNWNKGQVSLVVSDKKNAYVLKRAKQWGSLSIVFDPKQYANKQDFEKDILKALEFHEIDFIVLAGYMRLLGDVLLSTYQGRIINIHPSLLPAFPGIDAVGQALEYGVRVTGVTVHFVDAGMDTGPIIFQEPVSVSLNDNHTTLSKKIQLIEHKLYPLVIKACLTEQVSLVNKKVHWIKDLQWEGAK